MTHDVRDYRDLANLMVEYSQDYFDDYADERAAFAAFLKGGNRARTEGALRELGLVEAECPDESSLERALTRAGLAIVMTDGANPYRDFVRRLRTWLIEALPEHGAAGQGRASA
jgi:hypothetical protein